MDPAGASSRRDAKDDAKLSARISIGTGDRDLACEKGRSWLGRGRTLHAEAFRRGVAISLDEAARSAARLWSRARAPLLVLGPSMSNQAIEAAIDLARLRNAVIATSCPSGGLDRSGIDAPEISASLAEVRTSDRIILLDVSFERELPRLAERLETATGDTRRWVRVALERETPDVSREETRSPRTERWILAPAAHDARRSWIELVLATRIALETNDTQGPDAAERSGALASAARALAEEIRGARHVHFLVGGEACHRAVLDQLHTLAARTRRERRTSVAAVTAAGNARGVVDACTWSLGHPAPAHCLPGRASSSTRDEPLPQPGASVSLAGAFELARALESDVFDVVLACGLAPPGVDAASCDATARRDENPIRRALRHSRATVIRIDPDDAPLSRDRQTDVDAGVDEPPIDPTLELRVRIPGLDPRLDATVMRSDGVLLRLAGNSPDAVEDPAHAVLVSWRSACRQILAAEIGR